MAAKDTVFRYSVKGKIIFTTLAACVALFLAWVTLRGAFRETLVAVDNISAPNTKLRLVNELSRRIARLDQFKSSEMLSDPNEYYSFFTETKKLIALIDTLQTAYAGDTVQTARVKSLKKFLKDRDNLYIDYLKVREGLVMNQTFSDQVKLLNKLVDSSARETDSTFTTTQKKTSTTITPTEVTDTVEDNRGFFARLFGKKQQQAKKAAYKVVDEELHIDLDTVTTAKQLEILKGMGETMRRLEENQQRRSRQFVTKEATLNRANDRLVKRIISILTQVENEAVAQAAINNNAAKAIVSSSVDKVRYIVVAFILLTVILLYFILRDISRSNQHREEIEEARDQAENFGLAKHRFLSNMSHELRTPLQSIIGYTEQVMHQAKPNKKDIEVIHRSSEHLLHIVNEVLDHNRIVSGKLTFNNQPFDMKELLDEVIAVLQPQATAKGIELLTNYDDLPDDYVEGDTFRLKQVLYNIIGNAIKFTDDGEVKLQVTHNAVQKLNYIFTISDTGVGLSDDDAAKIFNEFEQADGQDAAHLKGTGLGLTISKALIEEQGGNIGLKSVLGVGSTFTFKLGFKTAEEQAQIASVKPSAKANNTADFKVWVVDDDRVILDLCSAILKNNGIKHRCFNFPMEVLDTRIDPDVKYILLDMRMPGLTGPELCKRLRKRVAPDVTIYALTAQVLPDERESILNEGFDGLIMKPFRQQELLEIFSKHPVKAMPAEKIDLSKVEKMTFGDADQLKMILERFAQDCTADTAELQQCVKQDDTDTGSLIVHRLAGRTAQIGANELAAELRMLEKDLTDKRQSYKRVNGRLDKLIIRSNNLVKQIRTEYLDKTEA
ncbi:hybrid sensor histidine kinase/response regulator [Mucilaginibacter myungsuensis]|uniref:histidine kinase n=1 Tax=Mucilaginibacter myungsuensis TaxID=649104 RepID=A0A929KWF1_9SPHI|nr:ATP-binding protein [Mucilaginibacter myungsuensis]MBE9662876.1 response regulator [Mucilaginibacter myungsuensis]MDN3598296.1 ATP-binding protein [Mucilaginibacter myungsuensis]